MSEETDMRRIAVALESISITLTWIMLAVLGWAAHSCGAGLPWPK